MAWTVAQLAALENAIASGATSVSYEGKSVTYGSLDNMLRIRDIIARSLGVLPRASATILIAHDRGFPGPAIFNDTDEQL